MTKPPLTDVPIRSAEELTAHWTALLDPPIFGTRALWLMWLRADGLPLPVLWAYARDLFQTPGFGDTIDFPQIKEHYYVVHKDINPTQIIPSGPDTSNWLTEHGRESLGGSPFGDGTPPGPVADGEEVPPDHGPGGIPHR